MQTNFDDAYRWFKLPNEDTLNSSTRQLVRQLEGDVASKKVEDARKAMQRLLDIGLRSLDGLEVAEVLVECGRAAFVLGDLQKSADYLGSATPRYYSRWHYYAAIQWMHGYVLWLLPERHNDAIIAWQDSIDRYQMLTVRPALRKAKADWYKERYEEMKKALGETIAQEGRNLTPPVPISEPEPPPAPPAAPPPETEPVPGPKPPDTIPSDFLRVFSVSETIPAGGFGPTGVDPHPVGHVEIDRILIDNKPYRILSLTGSHVLDLPVAVDRQFVVKVQGDSMDQANIQNGDYVLLRRQDTAKNGDIVAAEIVAEDSAATLKHFVRHGRKLVLRPNSSNPEHQEREFTHFNEGFYIRGVALAVFKPAPS